MTKTKEKPAPQTATWRPATNMDATEGTHGQGSVWARHEELKALFGEPWEGDGYKTRLEWVILFDDGTCATIYDWKQRGLPVEEVTDWSVGGHTTHAVRLVVDALEKFRREGAA